MPGYPTSEPGVRKAVRSQKWQYTLGAITAGTATTTTGASTASLVLNKPTLVDNTLLIATIGLTNGTINAAPSGWALIPGSASGSGGAGGTAYVFFVYYKYVTSAAGEASTYTWTLSTTVTKTSGIMVPFYNVHTGTQFDTNGIVQSLATATVASTFNGVHAAVRAGGMLIGGMVTGTDGGTTLTPPSGWTEITEVASVENAIGYKTAAHDFGYAGSGLATYTRADAGTAATAWSIALRVGNAFTWTKPAWARRVRVTTITAGGGGGGGPKNATNANRFGGGGGAGGYRGEFILDGPTLPATLAITVGRAGAGGTAAVANTTTGISGGAVEDCTVTGTGISGVTAIGSSASSGGAGGSTVAGTAGTQSNLLAWTNREIGGNGGAGSASAAGGTSAATGGPSTGGGAGGGFNNSNTAFDPGGAGATNIVATATLTNVGTAGTGDVAGAADPTGTCGGQGGAGGQANGAGNAGNGGNGGFPGGGGGGGGAAVNSTGNAGYGGRGGHGCVTIVAEG